LAETVNDVVVEYNVPATMRDGTVLRADIYRPAGEKKHPVLLQRTPYDKSFLPWAALTLDPIKAARAGYVVIIQDVRGRWQSEGAKFCPYRDEFGDGYDTVEWAALLPYSDGNVGMHGYSYYGMTQWQAASTQPPHLRAIMPFSAAMDFFGRRGGALDLAIVIGWILRLAGPNAIMRDTSGAKDFMALVRAIDRIEDAFRALPMEDISALKLGRGFAPYFYDVLRHDTYDDFHKKLSMIDKHKQVQVPALIFTGWYDTLLDCDLQHFTLTRREAESPVAREQSRLVVGPWAHLGILDSVGQLNFGLAASTASLYLKGDLTFQGLSWFDYWLKGIQNRVNEEPPVKLFVMGDNVWRDENEWPLARAQYVPFYFHSNGKANSLHGDGVLSPLSPREEPEDQFTYDPHDPVPTRGGNHILPMYYPRGPVSQLDVEERDDVLVYTSDVLSEDVEVTGPVAVKLYAASDAADTDFTAKLVDVYPDGRAYNIVDGIIRARYRNGPEARPTLVPPNAVVEYTVDLWSTSNVFKQGHRMRVEVSSSNFPHFDRNPNTGELSYKAKGMIGALQTVFHDAQRPSHILLPIIPS